MKSIKAVNFIEEDAEKLPNKIIRTFEPHNISLQFALILENKNDFNIKYHPFINILKIGNNVWLILYVTELDM